MHLFTEILKGRDENTTFSDLVKGEDPAFRKVKRQFEYRINKLIWHPLLGDLVDTNEVDFVVLNIFEQILKHLKGGAFFCKEYSKDELIGSPLFEALFDCNILYKSKYYELVTVEHKLYEPLIKEWVATRK